MSEQTIAIELSDVIEGLRTEMEKAQDKGEGKEIRFGVKDIEIELHLTIAKEEETKADIGAEVESGDGILKYFVGKIKGDINIGGKHTYKNLSTQKIKLNLSAKNAEDDSDTKLSATR